MNINIYNQFYTLIIFILTGFVIGILFDCFRIIRKTFKTPDIITYIEDVLFWVLVGIILLFSIFTFNNGEIRSYVFLGLIVGIIIYILTLSKYFIKVSVSILSFIKKIVYFPFKVIYNFLQKNIFQPFMSFSKNIYLKIGTKKKDKISKNIANDNFPNN